MDIADAASTTHLDDDADDATATVSTSDMFDCADPRDPDDPTDMADLTDADIYQQITRAYAAYPNEGQSGESPPSAESNSVELHTPPPTPPIQCDGVDFDPPHPLSGLAIDRFSPSAGALVPGAHQGSSLYQTSQEALGSFIWAPFQSQCDWEVVRWAKLRGPTSSAFTDLLAIPEVLIPHPHFSCC